MFFVNFWKQQQKKELNKAFNPIQDGPFPGCSQMKGGGEGMGKKAPLAEICHTYPIMAKLGTVIPYLKKIKKIYKSRDAPFRFC